MLCSAEQEKKRKYLAAVKERRATFTPFVVSVDGVLGHDAQHLIKCLCDQIAMNTKRLCDQIAMKLLLFYVQQTFACMDPG